MGTVDSAPARFARWQPQANQPWLAEQVQQLEERLKELEEERKELARFQQVDKQRRSLEYTIYDREAAETAAKLDQVSHAQQDTQICTSIPISQHVSCVKRLPRLGFPSHTCQHGMRHWACTGPGEPGGRIHTLAAPLSAMLCIRNVLWHMKQRRA